MMVCERCRNTLAENAAICPVCGMIPTNNMHQPQTSTTYNQYQPHTTGETPASTQSGAHPHGARPADALYTKMQEPHPDNTDDQDFNFYTAPASAYTYNTYQSTKTQQKRQGLVIEIVLSLIGLFGVGWLIAGEPLIGTILILSSVFIYWPLVFTITRITYGLGLICFGPFAIGAVILNAVLLNSTQRWRARHAKVPRPRRMPFPPPL